ncbi:hypothetical protein [Confluentibacter citreus]|uniref:hypothetical protein n=1 Tax=Confluentibacter citreus TaxID=2007307 RepID=UPI000C286637|nr:hypothetical protein [Confluentibacter citreus]
MNQFNIIQEKLEAFIRRYYTNELLKGAILFFAIGLLYFLFTLFIEYVLWLSTTARTILFWLFVFVEFGLLFKFIFLPLAKLFKLQKGIDYEEASKIIGKHFPEVNDKLLNVLQLHKKTAQSELLLASIEQKSMELSPIPFKTAINFKKNIPYLKYAAIPILILLITFLFGKVNWFSDSFNRVVNYRTAYEPPAPFQFFVVNNDLNAIENNDFTLIVKTAGDVIPENAQIVYDDETYFLQQKGVGEFEYVFPKLKESTEFQLTANGVTSKPYTVSVVEAPTLLAFEMVLEYPKYINKASEVLKGTGNTVVPEGTKVTWQLQTKSTENVSLFSKDTLAFEFGKDNVFSASKALYNNFEYTLSTSNKNLKNYENLAFRIDVVKDEYPELNVKVERDSLDLQTLYFYGQVSDDHGFSKLQLVYYPSDDETKKKYETISISSSNISEFITAFPNNLYISEGIPYELYFQVFDNDAINKFKSTKSSVFSYRKRTKDEEDQKKLNEQSETIKDLNKSLKKFDERDKELEELQQNQKEKSTLNFNDKKKLESFLKRQKQQDELMKSFNEKLKNNLEEFQKENKEEDAFKEDLKERLKENEEQLKKDEKLLEELEKLQDKINNEQLAKKLEELSKQNKNKKRSLEQLLELTKRFYVEKKLDKLKDDLQKMANDQEKLSNESEENNTKENQDKLNEQFERFKKELDNLKKESNSLRKPIDIPQDKPQEDAIKSDQKQASEELQKQNEETKKSAKQSQKKAAQKMKQLSEKMQSSMQAGGGEQLQEDVDMLRQILDNLVSFSLDEEDLMDQFNAIDANHNKYATYLKKQNSLRENFEHIDDSLFALSLRQPKLSETVNKEITEVYFNIDKAIDLFAEGRLFQGVSNQQFTITAANNLANFLSDVLDNMQESMSMGQGQGQSDMQLPDIIMSQEQLNKMMEEGMKEGESGKPNEVDGEGKEGEQGNGQNKSNNGDNSGEDGEGLNNDLNGKLYEIYQEQQQLREALEKQLEKEGMSGSGERLLKQMEQVELDLLNKGFTNQTLQKMMELQHQLLKLENATFQQGEDNKRESETNKNQYINNSINQIPTAKQYFKTTDILNKQALPLQQIYKTKVQEYFRKEND